MAGITVLEAIINRIGRLVFTTREVASTAGISLNSATQGLRRLEQKNVVKKMFRGVWALISDKKFNPNFIVPYLAQGQLFYLSFLSALHLKGVISQIPQVITVASTGHSKKIITPAGAFQIYQISPDFFCGYDWNKTGDYLIADAEKALVDCLYISSCKGRRFANFPELDLELLKREKVEKWIDLIRDKRIAKSVREKWQELFL